MIRSSILIILTCLYAIVSAGCNSPSTDHFFVNQATIENNTSGTIHNVRALHQPTGAIGTTNSILPHRYFNVAFTGRTMRAESSTISWSDSNGKFYQQTITLPKNSTHDTDMKHLAYRIEPNGTVTTEIRESNSP